MRVAMVGAQADAETNAATCIRKIHVVQAWSR